jgi:hypothetical protein
MPNFPLSSKITNAQAEALQKLGWTCYDSHIGGRGYVTRLYGPAGEVYEASGVDRWYRLDK